MHVPIYTCHLVRSSEVKIKRQLTTSATACEAVREMLRDSPSEQVVCVMLDTKHNIIGTSVVTIGTLDASLVHPREFFRPAIIHNAASIIMAHNHPSGDCTPSPEDWAVLRRLQQAGEILGIDVLDSIIVSDVTAVSLRDLKA